MLSGGSTFLQVSAQDVTGINTSCHQEVYVSWFLSALLELSSRMAVLSFRTYEKKPHFNWDGDEAHLNRAHTTLVEIAGISKCLTLCAKEIDI